MTELFFDMIPCPRFERQATSSRQGGFTLIELMITVVIIGILAAIAYPSYTQYVLRANRAEARSILLETAQFLERNYTTANRYDLDSAGNAVALPFARSPKSAVAGTEKYDITVANAAQTFTLNATPDGVMTGDACGTITLTNAGVQGAAGVTAGAIVNECWGR
ncbi:MAG: type IV pilin protein [Deltaproteobacteria bacterium]|nr:type IV pilin protein [Deltaproteobacteria bacterium]